MFTYNEYSSLITNNICEYNNFEQINKLTHSYKRLFVLWDILLKNMIVMFHTNVKLKAKGAISNLKISHYYADMQNRMFFSFIP